MKRLTISCFFVLLLSIVTFASFLYIPIEKRVKDSDLIVVGLLKNTEKSETDEFRIEKGTLIIEKVIYGNFVNSNEEKLKSGDELQVEWQNSKTFACQFGFAEDETQIWFLKVIDGKIEFLGPNTASGMNDLKEVEKHLAKKAVEKVGKKIELKNDVQKVVAPSLKDNKETPVFTAFSIEESEKTSNPLAALFVALTSILLYFLLYRSKFKIR